LLSSVYHRVVDVSVLEANAHLIENGALLLSGRVIEWDCL
jgi:hypothetical protein